MVHDSQINPHMSEDSFEVDVHGHYDVIPSEPQKGDVGFDIPVPEDEGPVVLPEGARRMIDTGVVIRPPEKCFEMIVPRSSSYNDSVRITNTVGVIDPSYCGQDDTIKVCLERTEPTKEYIGKADLKEESTIDLLQEEGYDPREVTYNTYYLNEQGEWADEHEDHSEVHVFVEPEDIDPVLYEPGDRFVQVLFLPFRRPDLVERGVEEFPEDARSGFGSTGR